MSPRSQPFELRVHPAQASFSADSNEAYVGPIIIPRSSDLRLHTDPAYDLVSLLGVKNLAHFFDEFMWRKGFPEETGPNGDFFVGQRVFIAIA